MAVAVGQLRAWRVPDSLGVPRRRCAWPLALECLRPTLDLRSVFKALLDEHLHVDANAPATRVFPDSSSARALRGLIRA